MRRTIAAIAIMMGVVGASLAGLASPAAAATDRGGIDVNRACVQQYGAYFGEAYLAQNNAWGWKCRHMEIVCYSWACAPYYSTIGSIDMNLACRNQYGYGAYARLMANHARGWRCYK